MSSFSFLTLQSPKLEDTAQRKATMSFYATAGAVWEGGGSFAARGKVEI